MIHENFVIVGFIIAILGGFTYVIDVFKGKAKPNRVTWFLWAVAPLIAFAAELDKGVGIQSLLTLSVGVSPILVLLASFKNKDSYWKLDKTDYLFGGLAVAGLVLWQITGEGNIAIAFAILADGLAAVPTVIKSYTNPESESSTIFGLCLINAGLTLLTIKVWNFETYAFPAYIMAICLLLFTLIHFKLGPKFNYAPSSKNEEK